MGTKCGARPDFERLILLIDHICYYVQVFIRGGGGVDST